MLQLKFKNSEVIAIVEEDIKPYACGFKRNEDVFYAIEINIYKNNNGRRGRLLSRYSYMWEEPTDDDTICSFISNILENPTYRKDYLHTSTNWMGIIKANFDDIDSRFIVIDDNTISKNLNKKLKTLKLPNNKHIESNLSLKLDTLSLLISDNEINNIKLEFKDRPSILYAMQLIIQGDSFDNAIKKTKNKINVNINQ